MGKITAGGRIVFLFVVALILFSYRAEIIAAYDKIGKSDSEQRTESNENVNINQINVTMSSGGGKTVEPPAEQVEPKEFGFKFVKTSRIYNIGSDMVMSDSMFDVKKNQYQTLIDKTFKGIHLKGLREILIANAYAFTNDQCGCSGESETGECQSYGNSSYIIIAAMCKHDDKVLYHEICHSMQNRFRWIFKKIKSEWKECNHYVSAYARTSIDEDFAETGSYYLAGDTVSENPKFVLFKRFFDEVKSLNNQ